MRLSQPPNHLPTDRLLCLSNGHGEDVIAVRILQALQQLPNAPKLAALPLVGEGQAYRSLEIPVIGSVKSMPSGGFIYMDGGKQLARDVRGGLLELTIDQFCTVRQWAKQGGSILAVGDIFPLLLAYLSGATYSFVGTAKSEYYFRDDAGKLFPQTFLDAWSGSVYYPWERWLMSRSRCRAVFPRDSVTTQVLQKWAIPAFDLGNPMMDGLQPKLARLSRQADLVSVSQRANSGGLPIPESSQVTRSSEPDAIAVALLPGSRIPEAHENWQLVLQAVDELMVQFATRPLVFLGAIAPNLNLEAFAYALIEQGWQVSDPARSGSLLLQDFPDSQAHWFTRKQATIVISQSAYADCLCLADWAIAMAGTATEQFVGLGKPAIIFPGNGPQFTPKFAEAQTRLLGRSVILVNKPSQAAIAIQALMQDPVALAQIAENGRRRMGEPGAAARIAACLMQQL